MVAACRRLSEHVLVHAGATANQAGAGDAAEFSPAAMPQALPLFRLPADALIGFLEDAEDAARRRRRQALGRVEVICESLRGTFVVENGDVQVHQAAAPFAPEVPDVGPIDAASGPYNTFLSAYAG